MEILSYIQSFFVTHSEEDSTEKPTKNKDQSPSLFDRMVKIFSLHTTNYLRTQLAPQILSDEDKKIWAQIEIISRGPTLVKQTAETAEKLEEGQYESALKTIGSMLSSIAIIVPLLTSNPKHLLTGLFFETAGDLIDIYGQLQKESYPELLSSVALIVARQPRIDAQLQKIFPSK